MKSAIHIISLLILLLLATAQCKDDDTQIFRAYAEGTISYSDAKLLQDPIHLVKDGKIIAETYPKDNGNFVLAGPYDKGIYKLQLKQYKIKSFSTQRKTELKLTEMKIYIFTVTKQVQEILVI